jgi:hypothetical protein
MGKVNGESENKLNKLYKYEISSIEYTAVQPAASSQPCDWQQEQSSYPG